MESFRPIFAHSSPRSNTSSASQWVTYHLSRLLRYLAGKKRLLGDQQTQILASAQHKYTLLNQGNNQNCLHPFNLNCLKLRTFICSNNGLSYSAFSDHSFTAPIHKLSISGVAKDGSKEVLDLELLRFFFPKLTHLKAVNYDRLSIDPLFFDNHKHLVSIVVGGFSKREDVDAIRMYCARRRINFTCIDEQWSSTSIHTFSSHRPWLFHNYYTKWCTIT